MSTGTINQKSVQRSIRFEHDIFEDVEELRGDVSFAMWVKRAVIQRIERERIAAESKSDNVTKD